VDQELKAACVGLTSSQRQSCRTKTRNVTLRARSGAFRKDPQSWHSQLE
jgi:hypothetical protein